MADKTRVLKFKPAAAREVADEDLVGDAVFLVFFRESFCISASKNILIGLAEAVRLLKIGKSQGQGPEL